MTCRSAVGIYNNLASGQTAVSVRSADYKASCRIDKELCILIYHICRNNLIKYILLDICMDLLLSYILIMLSGQNHCIQTNRLSILVILYCNLSLSVRTKIL